MYQLPTQMAHRTKPYETVDALLGLYQEIHALASAPALLAIDPKVAAERRFAKLYSGQLALDVHGDEITREAWQREYLGSIKSGTERIGKAIQILLMPEHDFVAKVMRDAAKGFAHSQQQVTTSSLQPRKQIEPYSPPSSVAMNSPAQPASLEIADAPQDGKTAYDALRTMLNGNELVVNETQLGKTLHIASMDEAVIRRLSELLEKLSIPITHANEHMLTIDSPPHSLISIIRPCSVKDDSSRIIR